MHRLLTPIPNCQWIKVCLILLCNAGHPNAPTSFNLQQTAARSQSLKTLPICMWEFWCLKPPRFNMPCNCCQEPEIWIHHWRRFNVLYSFSRVRLAAHMPSVVPSSDMVPPEQSCQSWGVHDNVQCSAVPFGNYGSWCPLTTQPSGESS